MTSAIEQGRLDSPQALACEIGRGHASWFGAVVREFWKRLKSVKFGITLIAVVAAGSLLATLIPQGRESAEYLEMYPKIVAELAMQTGLTRYFSSILFLIPTILLFINLGACTIDRFLRELRKKAKRRHGPDILHAGLLLLIVGSLISFSGREEGMVRLLEGDSVELPGGEILTLERFTDERYEDGRPKDWTSLVTLKKDGEVVRSDEEIRVNKLLRIGDITIYQASYSAAVSVAVTAADGGITSLVQGETFEDGELRIFFMTTEEAVSADGQTLAVLRIQGAGIDGAVRVGQAGIKAGPYSVATRTVLSTGLQAVRDPGYPIVLAALLLVGVGTMLTFFQKLKDVQA